MRILLNSKLFWLFPILAWGALAMLSAQWNLHDLDDMAESLAYERAESMFRLVQMIRLWNAQHGGVYVPLTKTTPSNPYLEDPAKDVETTQGIKLTKINPAYMTRQLSAVARESGGILFNMTSLKPINPGNEPDPWEREALISFEKEIPEVLELMSGKDEPIYRYMGPLFTKKSCMKCHEKQGYEIGDVRGGISITLPAGPILLAQESARSQAIQIHLIAFILLSVTTLFLLTKLRQQWRLVNKTKEQLAGSERFLRSITDAAGEGVVTMDNTGTITYSNPEARRLLGWPEQSTTIGRAADKTEQAKLSLSEESVTSAALGSDTDSEGIIQINNGTFLHCEGHQVPVSYVASPIMDGSAISGKVILFQDITLRKEMEKTLVRSETMSALGVMVAGVAHEVNTPVGVSVTSASYLATKTDDLLTAFKEKTMTRSALEDYLEVSTESTSIILSNLERAAALIKSFKQVSADQASEAKSKFNVKEYLDNILLTLKPELNKTALNVSVHCPDDIEVESYPGALSQITSNLVMNSITHAFAEGETGELAFNIEKVGTDVRIQYSDNGKGIPPEHIKDIFAPFFTTNRGNGSSGLGLHISHNLVHSVLNGTISATSEVGKGTQFSITFPISHD